MKYYTYRLGDNFCSTSEESPQPSNWDERWEITEIEFLAITNQAVTPEAPETVELPS